MTRAAFVAVVLCLPLAGGTSYGADTLAQAWSEALALNAEYSAAQHDQAAAAEAIAAAEADWRPDASLTGAYSLRSDQRNFIIQNPLVPGQSFVTPYAQREGASAAAIVNMPLYTGGATTSGIAAAGAELNAAEHRTASVRMGLMLAVGEAYLTVLRAQRGCEVAEHELVCLQAHERETAKRLAQLQLPRSDHLMAQVAVAQAEQQRLKRCSELQVARATYNRFLGRPLTAPVDLAELSVAPLAATLDELQQLAFQQRPELAELQAVAESRRQKAERLRAAVRPHVSVVGLHEFDENRYQTPQGISSAGVVVDWNVYDGGQSRRAAAGEDHRAAATAKLVEDLRSRIALELLAQKQAEAEAWARRNVAAQAMTQADESLRVSQLRYHQGLAVSSEVLEAQAQRSKAVNDYWQASYDAQQAGLRLRHAAGMLGLPP